MKGAALLRDAVLTQDVVQRQLVMRLANLEPAKNEQARHPEIAARK
jgi:hypothetical protein